MSIYSRISTFFVALAMMLVFLAGYSYVTSGSPSAPVLVIENTDLDMGEVTIPTPVEGVYPPNKPVSFTIRNTGSKPAKIIKGDGVCGGTACLTINAEAGKVIEPGESYTIPCMVSVRRTPGEFDARSPMYVDDGGMRAIWLSIKGTAVVEGAESRHR